MTASSIAVAVRRSHALLVANCFYPLVLASVLSGSFLALRFGFTGSMRYRFLVWNLFLAWVPYGCAVTIAYLGKSREEMRDTGRWKIWVALLGAIWLLTFPNAPYILTDVVHLMKGRPYRWWFDAGLVLSFALTGCFLGVASLRIVHERVREHCGELIGWALVAATAGLSGLGIYLGRFLRFNSWDVLIEPHRILKAVAVRIFDPIDHSQAYGVTLMFAALLFACYAVFRSASWASNTGDTSR